MRRTRRPRLRAVFRALPPLTMAVLAVLATTAGATPARASAAAEAAPAPPSGCDPLGTVNCLLPFPDDFFTVPAATPTGRRIAFPEAALPVSSAGVPTDPTQWNRDDGFSPGSDILLHVPGVDLARSGAAPITDIGSSLERDAPIVILDARTGERVPYWAELDANDPDPSTQALIIRPARDFLDGHRYIVALRDLRDAGGALIQPGAVFAAYRERGQLPTAAEEARRPHVEAILEDLHDHGVARHDLYLAWDFTVASEQDLAGRMLHIRDDAFRHLGNAAPAFSVASVTDLTDAQNPLIARQVQGTFDVPSYLDQPGGPPGSMFNYGPDGLPAKMPGNVQKANFVCNIPRSVATGAGGSQVHPGRPMLYGHGLLGSASEVNDGPIEAMAEEHGYVICGTDWLGLSQADVGADGAILLDISKFPSLPDRGQQAMLDFLFLGRLMTSPSGFDASPAFQSGSPARPVIAPHDLSYYGNSQGGIIGGALTAVAQDIHRSVLGVPGMNYSTLLNRSVDFAPFLSILDASYPDKLDQQVIFALLQMQWDRAEADGYAEHMTTDPLPGTPPHQVLMHEAFGDHQVANVATEVEARTVGARVHRPALLAGRSPDEHPLWGIPTLDDDDPQVSALVVWDSGTPAPPTTDTPPTAGADPHGVPRSLPAAREQAAVFLDTGAVIDVCDDAPCLASP